MACCDRLTCPGMLPEGIRHWWKWIITIALAVVYFVSWGNIHSYPLLFGPLQDEFRTSAIETGWVGSVTIGANSLASPLAAMLERKVGFRLTVMLGVLLSAVGVFTSSFAPQLFYLYFTYGVIYGIGINLTYHTSLCLVLMYFPIKNCRRATSIIMCGGTAGMLVFSPFMEWLIREISWRGALRVSGSIVLFVGIPFAFLCSSPEETLKRVANTDKRCIKANGGDDDMEFGNRSKRDLKKVHPEGEHMEDKMAWKEESVEGEDEKFSETKCLRHEEVDDNPTHGKLDKDNKELGSALLKTPIAKDDVKSNVRKWKHILSTWKCWTFIVSILISTFSWSFYWVNLVDHLSDEGFSQQQGAYMLTTCAAAELTAKIALAAIGDRLPLRNITILSIQGVITAIFTVGIMLIPNFGGGMGIILGVGMMRGVYQVVPYMSCVEIVGREWGNEAQTLTLVVQGIGYLLGALPSGAIYDTTDSYRTCLVMVVALFILSSVALLLIQVSDRINARRRKVEISQTVAVSDAFVMRHEIVWDRVTTV